MGLFALALPFLTWQQAALCAVGAFLFNWLVLPRLLGHRLISARPGVSDRGVLLYPVVVLVLIVLFRDGLGLAAVGWGILAFGDSLAGIAGQRWGRHSLPWNSFKSWEGFAGFFLGGIIGATALWTWFTLAPSWVEASPTWVAPHVAAVRFLGFAVPMLLVPLFVGALLESVPHGLDDNVLPSIAPPWLVWAAFAGSEPADATVWWLPLLVNSACAVVAALSGSLRASGIALAWILGMVLWTVFGWPAFALLLFFLLLGLAATFAGFGRKERAGLAERQGGRRGAAEVFGKGGVLLVIAACFVLVRHTWPSEPWMPLGWIVVAVLAAATADTWATEFGSLFGKRAYWLVPLRAVEPGTPGAVSLPGLAAAVAGAALVAVAGCALGLLANATGPVLLAEHCDVGLAVICTLAAFVATVVESLLPRLGPASHVGKNLVVTLLAPILVYAVLGVLR